MHTHRCTRMCTHSGTHMHIHKRTHTCTCTHIYNNALSELWMPYMNTSMIHLCLTTKVTASPFWITLPCPLKGCVFVYSDLDFICFGGYHFASILIQFQQKGVIRWLSFPILWFGSLFWLILKTLEFTFGKFCVSWIHLNFQRTHSLLASILVVTFQTTFRSMLDLCAI